MQKPDDWLKKAIEVHDLSATLVPRSSSAIGGPLLHTPLIQVSNIASLCVRAGA